MAIKTDINRSILNRNNFKLLIDKVPTVEYYVRTVNIPGITFGETVQAAGVGLDAFFPGDKASFDTLEVTFIVDEDLEDFVSEVERTAFEFYEAIATPGAVAPEMPEFLYNEEVELDLDELIETEDEEFSE